MTQPPFATISATPTYKLDNNSYIFLAGADIDGDGCGGNEENDPDFQDTTTYKPDLNSRVVRGFVLPGVLMRAIPEVCIGCQGKVTHVLSGVTSQAVVYDEGPNTRIGEQSIALAAFFGIDANPVTGGTQQPLFLYQFFPGVAAQVNGVTYQLQPMG